MSSSRAATVIVSCVDPEEFPRKVSEAKRIFSAPGPTILARSTARNLALGAGISDALVSPNLGNSEAISSATAGFINASSKSYPDKPVLAVLRYTRATASSPC